VFSAPGASIIALWLDLSTEKKMTGETPQKLDDPERADLLCFLVMAQLIGHASTGD